VAATVVVAAVDTVAAAAGRATKALSARA